MLHLDPEVPRSRGEVAVLAGSHCQSTWATEMQAAANVPISEGLWLRPSPHMPSVSLEVWHAAASPSALVSRKVVGVCERSGGPQQLG